MNCLKLIQGSVQSVNKADQKSLRVVHSNHQSYHIVVLAPFLTCLEIHALNEGRMRLIPAQKNDLFRGGV